MDRDARASAFPSSVSNSYEILPQCDSLQDFDAEFSSPQEANLHFVSRPIPTTLSPEKIASRNISLLASYDLQQWKFFEVRRNGTGQLEMVPKRETSRCENFDKVLQMVEDSFTLLRNDNNRLIASLKDRVIEKIKGHGAELSRFGREGVAQEFFVFAKALEGYMQTQAVGTLPRARSSFLEVFNAESTGPATMTDEIARKNLGLLASLKDVKSLELDSNCPCKLTSSDSKKAFEEEGWEYPVEVSIASIIESSFRFEKKEREHPDKPTSFEKEALANLDRVTSFTKEKKGVAQELQVLVKRLKEDWARKLPEGGCAFQEPFKCSPEGRGSRASMEEAEEIEGTPALLCIPVPIGKNERPVSMEAKPLVLLPANTPGEIAGSSLGESSSQAKKEKDPIEKAAERVATFMLSCMGVPQMNLGTGSLNLAS